MYMHMYSQIFIVFIITEDTDIAVITNEHTHDDDYHGNGAEGYYNHAKNAYKNDTNDKMWFIFHF